jgi:3-hydroxyphenylacetate 6-hydroxylase
MCVASHLANRGLYIVFLQIFANFRILPAESTNDEFGTDQKTIEFDPLEGVLSVSGVLAEPKEFSLRFVPRNEKVLIHALD